jgi:small subunit ribosomal protein S6
MGKYELALVLDSLIKGEEREKLINEIKNEVEKLKGKVEKTDDWGKKSLAFRMKKQNEGYFVVLNLEIAEKEISLISRKLRLNDNILRFLLIRR